MLKLKQVSIMALIVLMLGGCGQSPVKSVAKPEKSTTSNETQTESNEEEIDPASERQQTVVANPATSQDQLTRQQAQNATSLRDYLAAYPLATPVANQSCWLGADNQFVYLLEDRPEKPALNRMIGDPIVGDQRNFIYVRETLSGQPETLELEHLIRDDTLISYQLEPGKTYEVLIYLNNNATYDPELPESTVGDAKAPEIILEAPRALTPGNDQDDLTAPDDSDDAGDTADKTEEWISNSIRASITAQNVPGVTSGARLSCDQPVTLHWQEEVGCYSIKAVKDDSGNYKVTGEHVVSRSLRSADQSGADAILVPGGVIIDMIAADNYPSNMSSLFRFEFYVDPEQKESTMEDAFNLDNKDDSK